MMVSSWRKTNHKPGKGVCGMSEWTAAKETSGKSSAKVDEEGLEIAVCRHGMLLKALNMYRVWTDIMTLLAMGCNKRKFANMDRMLAKRYVKMATRGDIRF
ncbi:hypothetical protein J4Q44_G00134820 [Coregonus suidteri]|uniref:Uncharacterized protein n=1 Tax=Coregonus suidteri TaxID=861788 RepID=A0AAN8LP29_9TELE